MRHANHRFTLGVTKAHRFALMSNLAAALFRHGQIETTLTKAKALRPFAERVITLAKKAHMAQDPAQKVHFRRLALSHVRDEEAVRMLFNERVTEFLSRPGGYTRVFKLVPRLGDAANMALIALIKGDDVGFQSRSRRAKATKKSASRTRKTAAPKAIEADATAGEAQAPAAESTEASAS